MGNEKLRALGERLVEEGRATKFGKSGYMIHLTPEQQESIQQVFTGVAVAAQENLDRMHARQEHARIRLIGQRF